MLRDGKEFAIRKGEVPRTRFMDNIEAVRVRLIDWPDPERLKRVLVCMSKASWYEDYFESATIAEAEESVEDLMSGKVLGQGMEHPKFCFLVSGLSLHGTHALVRNRIGVCYLQRSLAVCDLRHEDVLVPRAFTKIPELLDGYKRWVEEGKRLYAAAMDSGEISSIDARMTLPKTIPSWCYVSCTLLTLMAIYGKRSDSQEESPEMNAMAEGMRRLVVERFPYMDPYFRSDCDTGKCLHLKGGYWANCVFARDERHRLKVRGNPEFPLHDRTKKELMLDADPYRDDEIHGFAAERRSGDEDMFVSRNRCGNGKEKSFFSFGKKIARKARWRDGIRVGIEYDPLGTWIRFRSVAQGGNKLTCNAVRTRIGRLEVTKVDPSMMEILAPPHGERKFAARVEAAPGCVTARFDS